MKTSAPLAALLLASCNAQGPPPKIAVEGAWARASVGGQSSAVYLTIRNSGGADRLIAVSSPAGKASIHSTTIERGVMRMRPLQSLVVPANSAVVLEPASAHVMLTGLAKPIAAGSAVPLELQFERAGRRRIEAAARAASVGGGAM